MAVLLAVVVATAAVALIWILRELKAPQAPVPPRQPAEGSSLFEPLPDLAQFRRDMEVEVDREARRLTARLDVQLGSSSPVDVDLSDQPDAESETAFDYETLSRRNYMGVEREMEVLPTFDARRPELHLVSVGNVLAIITGDGEMVSPRSPRLQRFGIYSFAPRGTRYYPDTCRLGDFTGGAPVVLFREPDNPHDANAVAVCSPARPAFPVGYLNKQRAKSVAKLLDSGEELSGVCLDGGPAGHPDGPRFVLVCKSDLMAHLRR